ncbi:MAG: bifunctional riboflavin kinase/FMN adenylyltransferase [Limnobacter sp. CACIAM 66H1]|uniref:bifunctional riboflavin kinase/FAD synthetase n=1 Tax=Limnobacter sp. CACIAM 66H1 TaxID=1813033 RepID=UPI0007A82592|nr:bifunctional riboflavin kinase/FAD synthetase [Limnobacter sp. CACIAM 66H1]KYP12361.1 MAG: bifunctional riboflavin kinase/FMN adenylyltransferase [Limnobacter sp. CACIAM 66H1]
MKIIRRPRPHSFAKGTALTIGNFDGVHSGHAELFRRVVSAARAQDLVPTVVTLHPHPKEFFNPAFKLDRISTLRDRMIEMKRCGIEQVCILPFNKQMATLNPEAFVLEVLMQQLNARQIWVGDDFRFGAKRAGDFALLKKLGEEHGFTVNDLAEVQSDGSRVSSSNIREALKAGDVAKATYMLGHPLVYSGHIVHGKKLGRTLGFPTMNLRIAGRASALTGILAVWVHGLEPQPFPAVASMGVRPTVEQSDQILLETFIPDWQGNAYGKLLRIEVLAHIRPEQHFDSLDTMVEQMHKDTAKAMTLLAANQPKISNTGC